MKNIIYFTLVAAFVIVMSVVGLAGSGRTKIDAVDGLYFDGETMVIVYSVISGCEADSHNGELEFEPETEHNVSKKTVIKLKAIVYDNKTQVFCDKKGKSVTVETKLDFKKALRDKISELRRAGYAVDSDYSVSLPPIMPAYLSGRITLDTGHDKPKEDIDTETPSFALVEAVDYSLSWHCNLDKHSEARRNNFDGYGATEAEARRAAEKGCAVTNAANPNCYEMSVNPDYTACDVDLKESLNYKQYKYGELPQNLEGDGWSCELRHEDKWGKGGIIGKGQTMEDARLDAAKQCNGAGHLNCDNFSTDSAHTACMPLFKSNAPKPVPVWTCVLDKHSAARKNSFAGTGSTKDDAKRDAESGCARTNAVNPNCHEMSLSPKYTSCTVELVTTQ
jgi:hypothetical protein